MKLLHVINAGVYRRVEKGTHSVTPQKWISFYISGLIRSQGYYPDRTLRSIFTGSRGPALGMSMPGFYSNFEYGEGRENYVVMYECDDVIYQEKTHQIYLKEKDILLPLSSGVDISPDEVESMRMTFQTIMEYHRSAIPRNQISADLMLSSLLLRFLQVPHSSDDPVEQLRKSIDADTTWEFSLGELCEKAGYNRDYLRREFIQRYKIAPCEYRIRNRLRRILHCFAYTNMSIKEIAFSVGMKNVTHLNLLMRKYYDKAPSQLLREYRKPRMKE